MRWMNTTAALKREARSVMACGGFDMEALLDVVKVEAESGYLLRLEFENGEKRVFDMSAYMDKRPFVRIKELPLFALAKVDYGTVVWPGNIDIAPETLYDRSVPA